MEWIGVVLAAWCMLPFPVAVVVGRQLAGGSAPPVDRRPLSGRPPSVSM